MWYIFKPCKVWCVFYDIATGVLVFRKNVSKWKYKGILLAELHRNSKNLLATLRDAACLFWLLIIPRAISLDFYSLLNFSVSVMVKQLGRVCAEKTHSLCCGKRLIFLQCYIATFLTPLRSSVIVWVSGVHYFQPF